MHLNSIYKLNLFMKIFSSNDQQKFHAYVTCHMVCWLLFFAIFWRITELIPFLVWARIVYDFTKKITKKIRNLLKFLIFFLFIKIIDGKHLAILFYRTYRKFLHNLATQYDFLNGELYTMLKEVFAIFYYSKKYYLTRP